MASILLSNETNPDVSTTQYKLPVDITFNSADVTASAQASVSASGQDYTQFTKVSNDGETVNILVGDTKVEGAGTIYYTPLYSEKINYQEWQSKINKNFLELS